MFRICEGYFNSAFDTASYRHLHLRYRDSMAALLAIEQITRASETQAAPVRARKATVDLPSRPPNAPGAGEQLRQQNADDSTKPEQTSSEQAAGVSDPPGSLGTDVPSAVADIFKQLMDKDYTREYCLTYLAEELEDERLTADTGRAEVARYCMRFLRSSPSEPSAASMPGRAPGARERRPPPEGTRDAGDPAAPQGHKISQPE